MPSVTYAGFRIRSFLDGTLYKARVQRNDGAEFLANGKRTKAWESSQSMDAESAIGQAVYAIDTGKLKQCSAATP